MVAAEASLMYVADGVNAINMQVSMLMIISV